jgi:hypothetical protein
VDDRNDRQAFGRHPRHVGEGGSAAHKHFRLQQKVCPGALDQLDIGQPVFQRDFLRAQRLLHAERMRRTALDAGIIGRDHHTHAIDHADARDAAAAIDIGLAVILVHAEAGERRDFKERLAAVEQQVDAFARQQLAAGAELLFRLGRGLQNLCFQPAELGDQFQVAGTVLRHAGSIRVETAAKDRHAPSRSIMSDAHSCLGK